LLQPAMGNTEHTEQASAPLLPAMHSSSASTSHAVASHQFYY